jgi:hypothetical protein
MNSFVKNTCCDGEKPVLLPSCHMYCYGARQNIQLFTRGTNCNFWNHEDISYSPAGGRQAAGFSPLVAYRVTYSIITQVSNGAIELVQLSALISALHFHSLAAARVPQSGIPWEISSYFPWLKQTYIQLTEHAGMKFSGLELLNTTVCTMIIQTVEKSSGLLTPRACSRDMFAIF